MGGSCLSGAASSTTRPACNPPARGFTMIGPFAFSNVTRKVRRKQKLTTELDSQKGDSSITYPTEGSWSQRDRPSAFAVNAMEARSEGRQSPISPLRDSRCTVAQVPDSLRRSGSGGESPDGLGATTMPTGHYDAERRRRRRMKRKQPLLDSRIGDRDHGRRAWRNTDTADRSDTDENSPTPSTAGQVIEATRNAAAGESGSPQRASKCSPLSATPPMQRHSQQSSTTAEPTASMPDRASTRTTSFAASSASGTDDPQVECNAAYQESKQQLRSKYQGGPAPRQEMVPSYDELYG